METYQKDSRNTKEFSNYDYEYNNNTNEYDENEIIKSFQYFDMSNNGQVDINELKRILTSFGNKMSEEEVEKIFKSFNISSDNKESINYFELLNTIENNK